VVIRTNDGDWDLAGRVSGKHARTGQFCVMIRREGNWHEGLRFIARAKNRRGGGGRLGALGQWILRQGGKRDFDPKSLGGGTSYCRT